MPAMAMGATVVDRDFTWTKQRTAGKSSFATSGWLTVFEKFDELNKGGCFAQPLGTSEDVARNRSSPPARPSASSGRRARSRSSRP